MTYQFPGERLVFPADAGFAHQPRTGTEVNMVSTDVGRSYFARASFSDPDGNGWELQEITERLPGREWED